VDLEPELDRLYQLPPGEFTAARDELAKRLRDEGERDQSAEVKNLRKPPVAVWLVNRLARDRELDVQRLAKAGQALTKSGGGSGAFAAARDDEQQALERLSQAAHEIAEREGTGAAAVDRAIQTLRAASLTDEGRRLLKQGRLTEELQPPGFEALTGVTLATPKRPPKQSKTKTDDRAERRRARDEAREEVRRLRAEERELKLAARTALREADQAATEAERLRKKADDAEAAAREAGERVARAEAELDRQKA
jgi:hypothetical protein